MARKKHLQFNLQLINPTSLLDFEKQLKKTF